MKIELDAHGCTTQRRMSDEDAAKWMHDFNVYGQAFSKVVDGIDVHIPYEEVFDMPPKELS